MKARLVGLDAVLSDVPQPVDGVQIKGNAAEEASEVAGGLK